MWNIIKVDRVGEERRQSRLYKWLLCDYFPQADASLYIDCNFKILTNLDSLLNGYDILMKPHPGRDCLYEEAKTCLDYNLDYKENINRQVERVKADGYPKHNGLHEGNVILRRHTDKIKEFGRAVWGSISCGSHRDQLSLDYVAWKMGVEIGTLPVKYFKWHKHKSSRRTYR